MPEPIPDINHIIEKAISGDAEAFGELYILHLDAIYRYVYYRIGDSEDAEDITEQIFLKAWEALPGYENYGKPFKSWLYRIAHNSVIDHHRKKKPSIIPVEHIDLNPGEVKEPSALSLIIEQEEKEYLANAISKLTDEQQQVVILRFIEGLSHRDVADIIGKNESACRMIQFRALATLQKLLTTVMET